MRLLVSVLFVALLSTAAQAQPTLYRVATEAGSLYLLGGTEVPDNAWLDNRVETALAGSTTLWVEIPPADPAASIPPLRDEVVPVAGAMLHPVAEEEGHGNLAFGDFFDVAMGERSVIEAQRLMLEGSNYRRMQPWLAAYSYYYAFWDLQGLALIDPQDELVARARAAGKEVRSLFADRAEFYRFMGRMSDFAETHLFQAMYNTFDWQRSGEYASRYNWATGNPDAQWIEKIRTQTPDHYRYMYQRRNAAIAEQVAAILAEGGTHFLYVDVDRLLGPDSLLLALGALGLEVTEL
jgi:uncharacterized protein YbaP (TraB family)